MYLSFNSYYCYYLFIIIIIIVIIIIKSLLTCLCTDLAHTANWGQATFISVMRFIHEPLARILRATPIPRND